ncbi:hypothetical protein SSS_00433 [Sarcoptes scabiei]|uniref:Uncharacterized protein n=1 Tax=Sarcoptes scabiei TaxID=52283 RepID=A0A834R8D5_SARSC|nr:hypothetical protein SSS_00433 [Sarcoptes scabiei]
MADKDNRSSNEMSQKQSNQSSRRHSSRSHSHHQSNANSLNNFKFHNFIFNETNQKFCLEEQDGNKKITVMHWKKSEPEKIEKSSIEEKFSSKKSPPKLSSQQPATEIDNDLIDSKLIKCEKFQYIPSLIDCFDRKDESSTIEESSSSDHLIKRISINDKNNNSLISLPSNLLSMDNFRPSKSISPLSTISVDSGSKSPNPNLQQSMSEIGDYSVISQLPPRPSIGSLFSGSQSSSTSFFSSKLNSSFSSSSNNLRTFGSEYGTNTTTSGRFSEEDSAYNRCIPNQSGSSISLSNSSCSAINRSFDNLRLNEKLFHRRHRWNRFRRRQRRRLNVDDEDEEDYYDEDYEDDDDSDSDRSDLEEKDVFYLTYRKKFQQKHQNRLEDSDIQSQPLDLSIKINKPIQCDDDDVIIDDDEDNDRSRMRRNSACDIDNNELFDSKFSQLSSKKISSFKERLRFENSPKSSSPRLSSSSSSSFLPISTEPGCSNWLSTPSNHRKESLSPSQMLSFMKCSSPNQEKIDQHHQQSTLTSNPFNDPFNENRREMEFERPENVDRFGETFHQTGPLSQSPIHQHRHHHQTKSNSKYDTFRHHGTIRSRSIDLFDALLEDEINKFLQKSSKRSPSLISSLHSFSSFPSSSSSSSRLSSKRLDDTNNRDRFDQRSEDIDKKIEDKLRNLRNEILQSYDRINFSDFLSNREENQSECGRNDDSLQSHFKLNKRKSFQSFLDDEHFRKSGSIEQSLNNFERNFRSPSSLSLSSSISPSSSTKNPLSASMTGTIPKSRMNHRNQIKRHLEDAFKQNGFLVKTKQVSDANNSATFCKFRQLRKYTRYYLKSWHNHLPEEVNKLWKGFLPPKSAHPSFLSTISDDDLLQSSTLMPNNTIVTTTMASTTTTSTASSTSSPPPTPSFSSVSSSSSVSLRNIGGGGGASSTNSDYFSCRSSDSDRNQMSPSASTTTAKKNFSEIFPHQKSRK